jgi:hypothetical protein
MCSSKRSLSIDLFVGVSDPQGSSCQDSDEKQEFYVNLLT